MHRQWRITVLGAVLCLLAAVLSLEAKLGWYSPDSHFRVELSSIKLQTADVPKHTAPSEPATVAGFPGELSLLLAFAAALSIIFISVPADITSAPAQGLFSPPHFFRPPPRF